MQPSPLSNSPSTIREVCPNTRDRCDCQIAMPTCLHPIVGPAGVIGCVWYMVLSMARTRTWYGAAERKREKAGYGLSTNPRRAFSLHCYATLIPTAYLPPPLPFRGILSFTSERSPAGPLHIHFCPLHSGHRKHPIYTPPLPPRLLARKRPVSHQEFTPPSSNSPLSLNKQHI
jgi:hypothetical protein